MTRKQTFLDVDEAERQISEYSRNVNFTVTEYTYEFIVHRLRTEHYYVPAYQRELFWQPAQQSKFNESVLMDLPIPFVFFWQDEDGRMEIVDGSQRIRTIQGFMSDSFALRDLESLPAANGLKFSDLPHSRRLKFMEKSLRVVILDNSTDAETRTEMFARINTSGTTATDAEVRRGSLPGPFIDMVDRLAKSPEFIDLTPISRGLANKREREELITRFFAYLDGYDPSRRASDGGRGDIVDYRSQPNRFFFAFVRQANARIAAEIREYNCSAMADKMEEEFLRTMRFVRMVSPIGFTKSSRGKQVPRGRFESIAVGSALALRADPGLIERAPDITPLLESLEFKEASKSAAANVKSRLLRRIRLVSDWLAPILLL